jgi:hypothetical protein
MTTIATASTINQQQHGKNAATPNYTQIHVQEVECELAKRKM